jgi:hypothetical protein
VFSVGFAAILVGAFLLIRYIDNRAQKRVSDVESLKAEVPAFVTKITAGLELRGPDLEPAKVYKPLFPIKLDKTPSIHTGLAEHLDDLITDDLAEVSTLVVVLSNVPDFIMSMVDYDVTIVFVEVASKRVIGRKRFQGPMPASRMSYDAMWKMGDRFWAPIYKYIEGHAGG